GPGDECHTGAAGGGPEARPRIVARARVPRDAGLLGRAGHDVRGHHGRGARGTGSVLGGVAFGAIRLRAPLPRQFAVLLGAVAASFAVYSVLRHPAALAVALFCGGALVAPALTVENLLVGRIVPAGARTEAYTWMVGVEVTATAAGLQVTGLVAARPGGLPWAFLIAGAAMIPAVLAAARRSGSITRAARSAAPSPIAHARSTSTRPRS